MASKRDLVEAQTFLRRRLVSAFVSGAPGGHELEPSRPARPVVAGVVLAALLMAGAAVTGYVRPALPRDWNDNTLVVASSSGARYLATGGVLYPVANTTSARLLVPSKDFRVVQAPDDRIATQPRGAAVGIVGAPDSLPMRGDLVQTGWTSCLDQAGTNRLRLATGAAARPLPPRSALLVTTGDDVFVVAGSSRYRVSPPDRDATLRALGLDATSPQRVPGAWLDQFPAGDDLAPLRVPGSKVLIAQADGGDRAYLRTARGLSALSAVASALFDVGAGAGSTPTRVAQSDVSDEAVAPAPQPAGWPVELPIRTTPPVACALLQTGPGVLPVVRLAVPTDLAAAPRGRSDVAVQPAHGALVRAVGSGIVNRGTVLLVDPTGTVFPLGAPLSTVQDQLGYRDVDPVAVPPAFLQPLRAGPELTADAARRVVAPTSP